MANQINVTSGTGNIQVTTSRSVIAVTTVANANTANVANYAGNVTGNAQPNITSVGTLANLTSTGNITAPYFIGNVVGNISGNIVVPGTNTSVLFNQVGSAGASDALQFDYSANVLKVTGNANVTGKLTLGGNIEGNLLPQANGTQDIGSNTQRWNDLYLNGNTIYLGSQTLESNATHTTISGVIAGNGAGLTNVTAATANSVAVGNVVGIGNIATVNLDGNIGNILYGDGTFAALPNVANVANANFANFAGTAFSVSGSNVSGAVANATFATSAGSANSATVAASANSVAGANVTGTVANATYATSAGTANSATVAASANSVAGANVTGTVANATFATSAGSANTANTVTDNAQPNITSVGTLTNLAVTGNITANTVTANYLVGNVSLTNIDSLYFDTAANVTLANVGQVAWDDGDGTLQLLMEGGNIVQQIGTQEFARVFNAEANALSKGEVVYVFGAQGNRLSVKRAQANSEATSFGTVGFVAEGIASGQEGFIITSGAFRKVNTNGFTAGNIVYLSPSVAGGFTTTRPVAPDQAVILGWVERVSATVGSIYVKVDNGYEINELHDVLIANATAGQALVYNSSNLWVNGNPNVANTALSVAVANVTGIGNIATVNLDGNAGNILYGNGVFAAVPNVANVANANYANFAGDVVNATQSNITSVGNLVSLTINNGVANTPTYQFNGNGVVLPNGAGNVDALTSVGTSGIVEAKLGTNYDVNNGFSADVNYFVNDGANTARGIKLSAGAYSDANTALIPSTFSISAPETTSNLANPSTGTVSSMQIGQGGLTVVTGSQTNAPSMGVFIYGNTTQNQASAIRFNRRRGNADSRAPVQASDYLGNVEWRASGANSGSLNSNIATFGAKVDSAWGGPGNVMPIGFEMDVVNSSNVRVAHNFYANGTVALGGNISANNLGNIVSVNLDGNTSNILYGNGVFATAPSVSNVANANYANFAGTAYSVSGSNVSGEVANANYASYAGDVVNASQSNITSVGNLTTFQVGSGSNDTLKFTPSGSNLTLASGNVVIAQNRITTATAPIDAVVLSSNSTGVYTQQYFVPDGSNVATIGSTIYTVDIALGAGNAATPGSITQRVFTPGADLANANVGTSLDMSLGTSGINLSQKIPPTSVPAGSGLIQTVSYGESGNAANQVGLRFQRRRGNNNTRLSLEPNDYVGNIEWRPGRGGSNYGTTAKFGAKVDGSYTANSNPVPIGMEMTVVNSTGTQLTHSFYANGNVNLNGAITANGTITATNIGNVANTNFNGNGSSVLLGNGVFGSAPASTPTSIQNGNSVVDFTGSGGDLRINIDGRQYATFNYNRKLTLTGVEGDFANASQIQLDNGGMQIINEDLGGGLPSFEFKSYYNSGGTIAPYVFQRARGNLASPANAQSGDSMMNQTFQAYSGSGFTTAGQFTATVSANDNAGNITTNIEVSTANATNGSRVILTSDIVDLSATSNVRTNANINVNSGAIVLNSNGLATANNITLTNNANANNITATNYANANNVTVTTTTTTKLIEQNLGTSNITPGGTLSLASNVEQYCKFTLTTGSANSTSTIDCANLDTAGVGKTYRFLVFNNSGGNQTIQTSGLAQFNPSGVIQNNKYSLIDVILHGTDGSAVFTLSNVA